MDCHKQWLVSKEIVTVRILLYLHLIALCQVCVAQESKPALPVFKDMTEEVGIQFKQS